MKFKILPKVHAMRIGKVRHFPGDIVDLPASYVGTDFLQLMPEPAAMPEAQQPEAAAVLEPEKPKRKSRTSNKIKIIKEE